MHLCRPLQSPWKIYTSSPSLYFPQEQPVIQILRLYVPWGWESPGPRPSWREHPSPAVCSLQEQAGVWCLPGSASGFQCHQAHHPLYLTLLAYPPLRKSERVSGPLPPNSWEAFPSQSPLRSIIFFCGLGVMSGMISLSRLTFLVWQDSTHIRIWEARPPMQDLQESGGAIPWAGFSHLSLWPITGREGGKVFRKELLLCYGTSPCPSCGQRQRGCFLPRQVKVTSKGLLIAPGGVPGVWQTWEI